MNQEIKRLIEAKQQWESDIKMYKDFLKGKPQTFEGIQGANEYIIMAKNRLNDIKTKLKELKSI